MEELFDFSRALALQPPTSSRNVAVITNAGGPGIIAADALEESGMALPQLSERIKTKLSEYKTKKLLLPVQSGFNPMDLSAEATSDMFVLVIETMLEDPEIGSLLLIPTHQTPTIVDDVVDKIAKTVRKYGKPVTVCDMGAAEMAQTMLWGYEKRGLPSFDVPERAARALWALSYYGNYLKSASA